MPALSFSLTENFVIKPILTLRMPLSILRPGQRITWRDLAWQKIQSEQIARVAATFISIFAIADALVHFGAGVYHCLPMTYNKLAVYGHFRKAIWFTSFSIVGSIVGVLCPDLLRGCRYSSPLPTPFVPAAFVPEDFLDVPPHIQALADAVERGEQQSPFHEVKRLWVSGSLRDRYWVVQVFSRDGVESYKNIRTELAPIAYRPSPPLKGLPVSWLSAEEVDERIGNIWERVSICRQSFYYHATCSQKALESILKSRVIEVRHEGAYRGAFVSTQPELSFGRYVLAFRKSIERWSPLLNGITSIDAYWAGFSKGIPVNDSTLAYIMLNLGSDEECRTLEIRCRQWAGREIRVLPFSEEVREKLREIESFGMGIPYEWPTVLH